MASASPTDTRLSGIISCAICFESKQGRNPKGLHCFHSFCRSCLQGWQNRLQDKEKIDCPVCRRPTKLPENGIDGLADDFKVAELIDLMKSIGDPFVCQGCVSRGTQSRAKVKCITCDRRLCEDCNEYHRSFDIFIKHEVTTELCELHGNKVTHVCFTCFLGLCVDCIFSRIHEKHDTCNIDEGLEQLANCIEQDHETYVDTCNRKLAHIEREKEKQENRATEQISILKGIWTLIKQEIDTYISVIGKKYISKHEAEVKTWYDEEINKYPYIEITKSTDDGSGSISKLCVIKKELREKLQQVRDADFQAPPSTVTQDIDHSYFADVEQKSKLVLEIYDKYKKAIHGTEVKAVEIWSRDSSDVIRGLEVLEDFSALVAYQGQDQVVQLDTSGEMMRVYSLKGLGHSTKVQRITTQDGNLYILCEDNQSLVTICTKTSQRYIREINNLSGGIYSMAYDPVGASFLFGQMSFSGGKVYKCMNDDTDATECSLVGGKLRVVRHQGAYKIVIARAWKEVLVYDIHGMLLSTLKQCSESDELYIPYDVAMLDHEILLVADYTRHRISMFNLNDGSFVDHLLSGADGISSPDYIACKYPFLWVSGSQRLHLFKLC